MPQPCAERLDAVVLPADGQYLGDWQRGAEVVGNDGVCNRAMTPHSPMAAIAMPVINCLRQLRGTLGPSLTGYARGVKVKDAAVHLDQAVDTYAYNLCSHMALWCAGHSHRAAVERCDGLPARPRVTGQPSHRVIRQAPCNEGVSLLLGLAPPPDCLYLHCCVHSLSMATLIICRGSATCI